MKKSVCIVIETVKTVLNAILGALYFVEIIHVTPTIPDADGNLIQRDFYYSIYEKLERFDVKFLAYVALALIAVSVMLSVVACVTNRRKVRVASHIVFVVSVLLFFALLWLATYVLTLSC